MKKMSLLALAVMILSLNLSQAKKAEDFEIYNKSESTITFDVKYSPTSVHAGWTSGPMSVNSGKAQKVDIPSVSREETLWVDVTIPGGKQYKYVINPNRKTVYVTFDDKYTLRPESGPWRGFWKVTESNLSLKNNVEREDIGIRPS